MSELWSIITATDPEVRNRSLDSFCSNATTSALIAEAADLIADFDQALRAAAGGQGGALAAD